jgi:LmeA-like phospholipid-binding
LVVIGILIVAAAAVLAGPGLLLSSRLEGDLQAALRAREVSVRAVAGPLGIIQGRVSRLRVHARDAKFDGTAVDEVTLDLRGVRVDPGRAFRGDLVLRGVESGRAVLLVREERLREYLESRGVQGATVRLDAGIVQVTGRVTVLNALVDVALRAGFVIRDGTRLDLDVQELRVSGLEVPRDVGNALASSVNPILSAPQEPVRLRLTGVAVEGGTARLVGEVAP